jgi:leucyl-tRNA synthetase
VLDHPEPFVKLVHQGMILGSDGEKMSKSRGNVINPDDVVQEHGADALRLYEMFMGPLEATKPWQTNQLAGVVRFRERVFSLISRPIIDDAPTNEVLREMHKTIKKVTGDIDNLGFNTAISAMMVYSSTLASLEGPIPRAALENLILLLAPFAPHVAEECWERLGHEVSLAYHPWPQFDEALCIDTTAKIAVQINGKVRATLDLEIDVTQDAAVAKANELPSVTKFTEGKDVKKIIYVPGRILNIVVAK